MRKLLVLIFLCLLLACLRQGQTFNYVKNPSRTSNVIKESTLKVEVVSVSEELTKMKLTVFVKSPLGSNTEIKEASFENDLFTQENLSRLRNGGTITLEGGAVISHLGVDAQSCDKVKFDKIPAQNDLKDMVAIFRVCEGFTKAKNIDVAFTTRGRRIQIGYDLL